MKVAVLTNDLQYELVEKNEKRIAAVREATPNFVNFLDKMRDMGHLVVHLQLINKEDDPNVEWYGDHLPCRKGSKGAEIIKEFLGEGDIIVEKNKDSGFYETELDKILKDKGVETIIVTGMQTQICVQTTAADGFFRGYSVWVPEDCVVSAEKADKDRALEWLDGYCGTVSNTDDILGRLSCGEELPRKQVKIP